MTPVRGTRQIDLNCRVAPAQFLDLAKLRVKKVTV